jgi:hypothetical protein
MLHAFLVHERVGDTCWCQMLQCSIHCCESTREFENDDFSKGQRQTESSQAATLRTCTRSTTRTTYGSRHPKPPHCAPAAARRTQSRYRFTWHTCSPAHSASSHCTRIHTFGLHSMFAHALLDLQARSCTQPHVHLWQRAPRKSDPIASCAQPLCM